MCAACTTHLHAPWRICDNIARGTVARLVRTDSAHDFSESRAMSFRRKARAHHALSPHASTRQLHEGPCPQPKGSTQALRTTDSKRIAQGHKKDVCLLTRVEWLNIDAFRANGTCNAPSPTTRTITRKPPPCQVGCPRRVLSSPAFSLHPLSRNGTSSKNQGARRQRP